MAPSFADLKQKATQAKNVGLKQYASARDRVSASSSAPRSTPPPPPPARSSSNASSAKRPVPSTPPLAPPPARTTRSDISSPSNVVEAGGDGDADRIDWTNLTLEDKLVFFSWLDEFFAKYLNIPIPPRSPLGTSVPSASPSPKVAAPLTPPRRVQPPAHVQEHDQYEHASTPPPSARNLPPSLSSRQSSVQSSNPPPPPRSIPPPSRGPPRINLSTKPSGDSVTTSSQDDFQLSYPPPTTHGSAALDTVHYFRPDTQWDTAWYTSDISIPPPLQNSPNIRWAGSSETSWRGKSTSGCILFSDLSICWYTVSWPSGATSPMDSRVKRSAQYLPCPTPLSGDALFAAYSTYAESIASYAESFVGTGRYCASGECWDMANEALKHVTALIPSAAPIPSIARTHGHLIYSGTVGRGRWRGGDDRIRRGDIVEWRTVRINLRNGYALLGDPDHTAVVTADLVPLRPVSDGAFLSPADVGGALEVVEQSVGNPPKKTSYELSGMVHGEVWVYRPIGMRTYLGLEFGAAQVPKGVKTFSL